MQKVAVVVVLCGLLRTVAAEPSSLPKRVGFINTAGERSVDVRRMVELRADLTSWGYAVIEPGPMQQALEEPLGPDPAAARVAQSMGEIDSLVQQATSEVFELAYRAAQDKLDRAQALMEALPVDGAAAQDALFRIYLLRGQILAAQGQRAQALASFGVAARMARDRADRQALDPADYPPKIVELFARAREPHAGPAAGLVVTTEPAGAAVFVDGALRGPSPQQLTLAPGPHYVTVRLDGHVTQTRRLDLVADAQATLTARLESLPNTEQARVLRRRLHSSQEMSVDALDTLATVAGVDFLIALRQQDQVVEARVYDAGARAFAAAWGPPDTVANALPKGASPQRGSASASIAPNKGSAAPVDLLAPTAAMPQPDDRARAPWYQPTWDKGLLVIGALAASAAVIFAVTRDPETNYETGNWRF